MEGPAPLPLPCSALLPPTRLNPSRAPLLLASPIGATCLSAWHNLVKEAVRLPVDALHHHGSCNQALGSSHQALRLFRGAQSSTVALPPPMQDTSLRQDHPEKHTKEPAGRLDTLPVVARYQMPLKSITRASRCIPASDAGTYRGPLSSPSRGHSLSPTSEKWPSVITQKAPLELYQ